MSTKQSHIKQLTLFSLFTAILIMQTFIPVLGYIHLGFVDFTIVHITVILAACLLGSKLGTGIGLTWGLLSMIKAYTTAGILNPLFYNPLISVLPRMLVGLLAGVLFQLLSKKISLTMSAVIASFIGTITNTGLVLGGFYVFGYQFIANTLPNPSQSGDVVLGFILTLISTNTLFELLSAIIVTPALVKPLSSLFKK
ncbi:ECF transporter S component [Granulicatella sp. zg-ZJ]|uniref:ECF transporter S component n=1 Tax=unclassified Granulicatella TaxID=2630493 RepID=UPI0013C24DFF|nr:MULTISPECIES: ECF transporter S component [unclassified Granulicatella]MBS4750289.1 ECF transporter S component [Carnobacteriaceae bacterium zg-ZUI78]NEW63375.1 ECF transporter S component [Granulicatella sp. zg-ZJ]NEW66572.1 ECF transporter S component [Granulicatella sp. zg-84]QMI85774.1 ECF transporter S component [Carnobacteriaceae bacterium zg-84]